MIAERVFVVRLTTAYDDFAGRLRSLPGAALVRPLPPDRAVITIASPATEDQVRALEGVRDVVPDRLEHPLTPRAGRDVPGRPSAR